MKATAAAGGPRAGDAGHSAGGPKCPRCDGSAYRIPRRFVDLLLSFFVSVRRYRCRSKTCGWEGNLRVKGHSLQSGSGGETYEGRNRPLESSRMAPTKPSEKKPQ